MGGLYLLLYMFIYILCLNYLNVIYADLLNPLHNNFEKPNCDPNKIYNAENITCICTEKGDWPNVQCYLYFQRVNSHEHNCEPDKFIIIDCNVCRCGHDGKVNRDQCTKHKCDNIEKTRRYLSIASSCEPNRWYSFAPCRICYCVHKRKLICNNGNINSKIRLGNYELSECSEDLLLDMKKLTSEKKVLRFNNKKEIIENKIDENSSIETERNTQEIEEETTTKRNQLIANENKAKSKLVEEGNDMPSVKRKVKKSKANKINSGIDWNNSVNKNQSHVLRIKLPNVFDNILNLVLRKSLSINSGNKCKPGSNMQVGCNICFCLANGKLLCTEKKC